MKRSLFFCFLLAAGLSSRAANSLLTSPVSGALGHSRIAAMGIASNGTDVVLLLADNTKLYALDIADNDPTELAANAITSIPDFVNSKLKPVAGGVTLTVLDIEVNPISKSVYVLAEASGTSYVFKVKKNGAAVTLVNLSSISHSTISWGGTFAVNAMTFGNNKLYASSGSFSLDGALATVAAPFAHGAAISQRSTSMFKSNWGGTYFTKAPLETMTYGMVKTKHRLMGVTTCAPGFSLDLAGLTGTGVKEVTEDFNINMGTSVKVVFQHHDGKDWLFDLHDNKLYRIGESMLDGSNVTAGKFNNSSVLLRDMSGARSAGLTDDQFRIAAGTYKMISFWDDYRMVVLETGGILKMMQFAATAPGLSVDDLSAAAINMRIYPNPAQQVLHVELPEAAHVTLQVFSMEGRLVQTSAANGKTTDMDISALSAGQYILKAQQATGQNSQVIFTVQ